MAAKAPLRVTASAPTAAAKRRVAVIASWSRQNASNAAPVARMRQNDPARSSAIIQIDGQPPRLLFTGDELEQGVTLQQVNANGVQIMRNGRIEQLMFPKSRSPLYAPEPYSEPPANAPDPAAEQMQQQMEALRQQLEQAIDQPQDTPTNDQPMEED